MDKEGKRIMIGDILRAYRFQLGEGGVPVTFGDFAAGLSEPLKPLAVEITPERVYAWELGRAGPADEELCALRMFAQPNSWQWKLAGDLRAAKYPEVYRASSEIAKAILNQAKPQGRKMPTPCFRFRVPRSRNQGGGGTGTGPLT